MQALQKLLIIKSQPQAQIKWIQEITCNPQIEKDWFTVINTDISYYETFVNDVLYKTLPALNQSGSPPTNKISQLILNYCDQNSLHYEEAKPLSENQIPLPQFDALLKQLGELMKFHPDDIEFNFSLSYTCQQFIRNRAMIEYFKHVLREMEKGYLPRN